jgi:hypothetical protein
MNFPYMQLEIALESERTTQARLNPLEIPRGEGSTDTLHVTTKQQIETGAHHGRLSQASSLPVLDHVIGRTVVLPDSVCDEGNEEIVKTGAVKVFGADN